MQHIIINGRRVPYDGNGIHGSDLTKRAGRQQGRRPVIHQNNMEFKPVDENRFYGQSELKDKRGRPVKVASIPDRTKGAAFGSGRSAASKALIRDQVYDIAAHCFKSGVEFDEDHADWFVVPEYRLPRIWPKKNAPVLILFPAEYPKIPPIGFYLPSNLKSPNGHLMDRAYHGASGAPTLKGWKWYCAFVNSGSWRPAPIRELRDWRRGDNLWTYMTLVNEVLSGKGE